MVRAPIELVPNLGGRGVLIEQQDFGEVVAQACASLLIGAGDGSWSTDCNGGRLSELGHSRVQSIGDDIAASSTRRSIGSLQATSAGASIGDSSLIDMLFP